MTTFRNPLADPLGTRRGPPLVRGPQFENRWSSDVAIKTIKNLLTKLTFLLTTNGCCFRYSVLCEFDGQSDPVQRHVAEISQGIPWHAAGRSERGPLPASTGHHDDIGSDDRHATQPPTAANSSHRQPRRLTDDGQEDEVSGEHRRVDATDETETQSPSVTGTRPTVTTVIVTACHGPQWPRWQSPHVTPCQTNAPKHDSIVTANNFSQDGFMGSIDSSFPPPSAGNKKHSIK